MHEYKLSIARNIYTKVNLNYFCWTDYCQCPFFPFLIFNFLYERRKARVLPFTFKLQYDKVRMNIHNHQILIRHSTTTRRSLMKLDPLSLVDLVIKWLSDKSCLSPSGDREMILEKYRTMKMNKPFKTKVCDSIEEDYPGGLSWRQYGLLISYQIQSKPTSYNWSGFEIEYSSNTPKPSPPTIQSLCTTLSSSLTLTHAHHLYISNIKFGEDEINVIILTFLPDPPDRLPPSNHTILIIPLLPSNIILITPVPSIFSPYLTAALLSGYGHARKINNLKFTTKNVESAKILALDNASQGVWNRLTNTNHINNVLDNAPEDDHDDVVLGDELDKLNDVSFAGDGYDQFIVPDDEHPYKKRNAQVVDMWANQSLPKLQHLSYDVSCYYLKTNMLIDDVHSF